MAARQDRRLTRVRIAMVIGSLNAGGAERATLELARQWRSRGHEVVVITIAGDEARQYEAADLTIAPLGLAAAAPNPIAAVVANVARVRALRREIVNWRAEVVVAMVDAAAILTALACVGLPVAAIGSERIAPQAAPLPRIWRALRWGAYGLLDVIVAQTQRAADWLPRHTLARRTAAAPNVAVWPLPNQPPFVSPADHLAEDERLLLAVGRLTQQKRFDRLIEAFARARRDGWVLAILGEGPDRPALEGLAERLGVGDRVRFPGRAGNMADWYERAAAFALSSDFEGFPNVLVEAMAHGVASVSVDCPFGPAEIIRPGVDGLLVPATVGALEQALAALMDDDALRSAIAARAVEVRERFAAPAVMRLWDEVLETALARRRGRRAPWLVSAPQRETTSRINAS